jgi:hypothetical protein
MLEHNLPCVPVANLSRIEDIVADHEFLTLVGKEDVSKAMLKEENQD